ncbi:MAG: hypothetical protein IT343_02610 [Candidatus Melainabacteria bacterium]|nr:hypothetical protein [Candidatus Melainabacteria bacterium]
MKRSASIIVRATRALGLSFKMVTAGLIYSTLVTLAYATSRDTDRT